MKIHLRGGVRFHDGTPVNATQVVAILRQVLPQFMGPAFDDVDHLSSAGDDEIEIALRRASPFLLEALDAPISKLGTVPVGTGSYIPTGPSLPTEMRANTGYYLGTPAIDRIAVSAYPNVRSAWADLLRNRIDVLYEVGVDALDSLTSSTNVTVFTYVRHYQYVLLFNTKSEPLRSPAIRSALNEAIDRDALVQDAFDGHAMASRGPVWPGHWAFHADVTAVRFDPQRAASTLSAQRSKSPLRFKCLIRPGLDRLGLVVKRQLEAVGVEMSLEETPFNDITRSVAERDFDAILLEVISAPSLFRPYQIWHSGGLGTFSSLGTAPLDAAFDQIRYAADDEQYRKAVAELQRTVVIDPPAVFLAWSERARAVSRRFRVPAPEPGRDILTTLRLWRPINELQYVGRN
jgi:peptide/nickel transport system substrate-binding protein